MDDNDARLTKKMSRLVAWTVDPKPMDAIGPILAELDDADLLVIMVRSERPVSQICWAEYGRRMGFAEFEVTVSELGEDRTELKFMAEAKPIHSHAIVDVKPK